MLIVSDPPTERPSGLGLVGLFVVAEVMKEEATTTREQWLFNGGREGKGREPSHSRSTTCVPLPPSSFFPPPLLPLLLLLLSSFRAPPSRQLGLLFSFFSSSSHAVSREIGSVQIPPLFLIPTSPERKRRKRREGGTCMNMHARKYPLLSSKSEGRRREKIAPRISPTSASPTSFFLASSSNFFCSSSVTSPPPLQVSLQKGERE